MKKVHDILVEAFKVPIANPDSIAMVDAVAAWAASDHCGQPETNWCAAANLKSLARACDLAAERVGELDGITAKDAEEISLFRDFLRNAKGVPRGPELKALYEEHYGKAVQA